MHLSWPHYTIDLSAKQTLVLTERLANILILVTNSVLHNLHAKTHSIAERCSEARHTHHTSSTQRKPWREERPSHKAASAPLLLINKASIT
jgi:hypothetical protein